MEIITAERLDPTNLTCCLEEEVLVCRHQLFGPSTLCYPTILSLSVLHFLI